MNITELDLRQLQLETARALATFNATSDNIHRFNALAHHNSQLWYKAVIQWYIDNHGDLPSKIGPGKDVQLKFDNV